MPKLRIKNGAGWKDIPIDRDVFRIGRASGNHYQIESGFVSRNHCEIFRENNLYWIRDQGSTLGTQLNGKMVTRSLLNFGDRIVLSERIEATFLNDTSMNHTETLRVQKSVPHQNFGRLLALDGPLANRVLPIRNDLTLIGRDPTCDICIDIETVSKFHAEILREDGGFFLQDLNSGNGTFVGDRRIRRQQLKSGDLARFDWVTFRFEDANHRAGKSGTRLRNPLSISNEFPSLITRPENRILQRPEAEPWVTTPSSSQPDSRSEQKKWLILLLLFLIFITTAFFLGLHYLSKTDLLNRFFTHARCETVITAAAVFRSEDRLFPLPRRSFNGHLRCRSFSPAPKNRPYPSRRSFTPRCHGNDVRRIDIIFSDAPLHRKTMTHPTKNRALIFRPAFRGNRLPAVMSSSAAGFASAGFSNLAGFLSLAALVE